MSGQVRPVAVSPDVSVDGERVTVVAGARHLVLTVDAAWELLSSLSMVLQSSLASAGGSEKEDV